MNLKPCPYCGGNAEFKSKRTHHRLTLGAKTGGHLQERYIRCSKCHAKTQAFGKIDNCVNAWQSGAVYPSANAPKERNDFSRAFALSSRVMRQKFL